MVNNSHYTIPQGKENKKQYTTRDGKRDDIAIRCQHITIQPVNWILHAVDNNIFQNLPILLEYFRMNEDIYGTSIPNLRGKTVRHKVQHMDPILAPNSPKGILDR